MAGKGAPKGNTYAKKAEHERGIVFRYYLNAYEYDFLKSSVRLDGGEPTPENVLAKVKTLTKETLRQEMIRVLTNPDLPKTFEK